MSKDTDKMKMDLELAGYSPKTIKSYLMHVNHFSNHFAKPLDSLKIKEIREYLHYLITIKQVSNSYVNCAYSALKFYFQTTLNRFWDIHKIPRAKKVKKLPSVLSMSDIKKIFDVTTNLKHKAILMTTYSAGLRVSEVANLKISDIDSSSMQIFINQGKGNKDRYSLLSQANLSILRKYFKQYKPQHWLFEGVPSDKPISNRSIQRIFKTSKEKAGISKNASLHTLRHSFATHLLEAGTDITYIQKLLGHADIKTTCVYLHLKKINTIKITSPLDIMAGVNE